MSLIVYGHVAAATTVSLTPPIYIKQLGVAFFLFATGFTLARDQRGAGEVLFNRLFSIYLFGLSLAALISLIGLMTGSGLALSNYLPFLGGAHVAFDNFPANPTTWYLGTYLHLLVLWAIALRRIRVRPWMVVAVLLAEIPVRALLVASAGSFIAYMLLTNWAAVFLFGLFKGQQSAAPPTGSATRYVVALAGGLAVWMTAMRLVGFDRTFPFMSVAGWPASVSALTVSAGVSFVYLAATWLVFAAARRVPAPGPVRFVARNSLIIFLVHMPIYFALAPVLAGWALGYWTSAAIQLLVCLVGLAVVSETILAFVKPELVRARVFEVLSAGYASAGQAPAAVARSGGR